MLDYGVRSACCYALVRMGIKVNKRTKVRAKVWVCCRCGKRNIAIIPKDSAKSQKEGLPFTLEERSDFLTEE